MKGNKPYGEKNQTSGRWGVQEGTLHIVNKVIRIDLPVKVTFGRFEGGERKSHQDMDREEGRYVVNWRNGKETCVARLE